MRQLTNCKTWTVTNSEYTEGTRIVLWLPCFAFSGRLLLQHLITYVSQARRGLRLFLICFLLLSLCALSSPFSLSFFFFHFRQSVFVCCKLPVSVPVHFYSDKEYLFQTNGHLYLLTVRLLCLKKGRAHNFYFSSGVVTLTLELRENGVA